MKLSSIPPIDAPNGAYRERPIDLRKTALLSIDMQNSEWSPERMAKARVLRRLREEVEAGSRR